LLAKEGSRHEEKIMAVVTVCLAFLYQASSLEAKVYHYQDLSLQGLNLNYSGDTPDQISAINDDCWIVGFYYDSSTTDYLPFLWRPGKGRTTLSLGGMYRGKAHGINNKGQIVGEIFVSKATFMPHYPCLWTDPVQDPTQLFVFPYPDWSSGYFVDVETPAYAINDSGQIAGDLVFDYVPGAFPTGDLHAARWTAPQVAPIDLNTLGGATSRGRSINNANLVAGTAAINVPLGNMHACLWVPGSPPKNLTPSLKYSFGNAINNQGNVVGRANFTGTGHAFFWNHKTDVAKDLTVGFPEPIDSEATGISDADEVVGHCASGHFDGFLLDSQRRVYGITQAGGESAGRGFAFYSQHYQS
jgi:uncharacterized membrane protein